jgi:hypothetical protein
LRDALADVPCRAVVIPSDLAVDMRVMAMYLETVQPAVIVYDLTTDDADHRRLLADVCNLAGGEAAVVLASHGSRPRPGLLSRPATVPAHHASGSTGALIRTVRALMERYAVSPTRDQRMEASA